ncbi:MAG: replication-associated recombination protein A [Bacteroidia bacterium]|nr:replication-associated recombination protein A [Bacteroidia bacterium]
MTTEMPLAERMRPTSLLDYVGQQHLVAPGCVLHQMLTNKNLSSLIFWGPPGVGKTSLAKIIAQQMAMPFYGLSAIAAGVREVREIIQQTNQAGKVILFIDEIHRFNKAQQDALLGAVEQGQIILIGATTENPSFEVINALLSRCQVYVLKPLTDNDLIQLLQKTIATDILFKTQQVTFESYESILKYAGGDARKLLNVLEMVTQFQSGTNVIINNALVEKVVQQNIAAYDKGGELHYDIISAFIKSMRGSDPNAALYYLARMLQSGEDPKFIARRMLIFSSEDIGNANPNALLIATACFQSVQFIGYPECDLILSQAVIYLSTSVKSNASYLAIREAQQTVTETGNLNVPLHLRNAPTKLMKHLDYGKNYKYPHDFENSFVREDYLPESISNKIFYNPANNARENEIRKNLKNWWPDKY